MVRALALEEALGDWMLDAIGSDDAGRGASLAQFVAGRVGGKRIEDLLQAQPVTVAADDPVARVAATLVEHRIHHAPVVDAGEFVGVVSTFDLTAWIAREGAA